MPNPVRSLRSPERAAGNTPGRKPWGRTCRSKSPVRAAQARHPETEKTSVPIYSSNPATGALRQAFGPSSRPTLDRAGFCNGFFCWN
jgi:hypothetical protein